MAGHGVVAKLTGAIGVFAVGLAGIVATGTAVAGPPGSQPTVGPQIIATGGSGRLRNAIDWVQWGSSEEEIDSDKVVWTTPSKVGDDHWISTRCAVTSPAGGVNNALSTTYPLTTYKSGDWPGDGLPYMYNQGGSGGSNTMVTGLKNKDDAGKVTFDFSCATYLISSTPSPTLDASTNTTPFTNVPMQGLVFADAESNNWVDRPSYSQQEYIKATPQSNLPGKTPTWRLIDSYRNTGCATDSVAELKVNTMRFRSNGEQCSNSGGVGPASVMFLQNSQSARVTLKGGGNTAVALGSIALSDFGDAPASYGVASSLFQPQWAGGKLGTDITGTTYTGDPIDPDTALGDSMVGGTLFNLSDAKDQFASNPAKLANSDEPTPLLGVHEDSESDGHHSADADGDDVSGDEISGFIENDEDGIAHAPGANVQINPADDGTFTQKVSCKSSANAEVKGWIDWNHNGHFDDATEGSDQVACSRDPSNPSTGQSATLTWNVPADAQRAVKGEGTQTQSFERVRITDETVGGGSIMRLTPTGVTTGGEVEDYAADVHVSMLSVRVNLPNGRHDPSDQFAMSTKNPSNEEVGSATTTGTSFGVQNDQVGPKYLANGVDYTISAPLAGSSASTESRYSNSLSCIDLAHGNVAVPTDANGKFTMPADSNVQCTFTKSVRSNPTLQVTTHVNGGSATPADFPTSVAPSAGGSSTDLPNDSPVGLTEGSYKITTNMSRKPGYRVTSPLSCKIGSTPVSVTAATVALANGDNVVCEQTVAPKAATLTLKTQVERGDAKPGDFDFTVSSSGGSATYTENNPQTSAGGITGVTGSSLPDGYEQDGDIVYYKDSDTAHVHPMTLAEANTALNNGESVTGIRKVTTHRSRLTVKRERHYRYGGTAAGDGSRVKLTPQGGAERDVTLDQPEYVGAGTYSVRQLLNAGYRQSDIKAKLADGTPITINPDGTFQVPADADVIVTVKNVDDPGTLEWSRSDQDGTTLLRGSRWLLTGPEGQSLVVDDCTAEICTGADQDPTPGKFRVSGLKWGAWTVTETVAPEGHQRSQPFTLTLGPGQGAAGLSTFVPFREGKPPVAPSGADDSANAANANDANGNGVLTKTGSSVALVAFVAVVTLLLGMLLSAALKRYDSR
ncbi:CshA/CshB family fibrillar adhesin-related protein [Bifidobacterium sp. ESL0769]|uniref:CshA/CshB family fibrillar adhesin-related protein n=1 Tax=Bifidobacterium sp. ESL0769 TaxID=2983229 RepID=UPI0023F9945E|nr:CshA/CshB family fibrillar adhesin-related protein [Bifidobacterium sp. ESL0769]WEV67470.1 CshA/CshB family fibrillar adhesin-related protein [Bifidobacterium sp. ESL0769]